MSDPTFYAGQTLPADDIQALGLDDVWTPTLTGSLANPSLGTGSVIEGDVHFNGRLFVARFNITAGTSGATAGTGSYQIDLPAELTLSSDWAANYAVGLAEFNNAGTAIVMEVRTSTATRLILRQCSSNAAWSATNQPIANNVFCRGTFHGLLA